MVQLVLTVPHTLTGHSGKVMAAKFLEEPTKVITGSHDRTLKIWDLRSRMCTETKFAGSSCNDLVTSDGAGSTIISGHFDKRIRFWDIRTEMSANHIMLQGKVTSLDLSRDSNYLLACVRDDTIQLIDLRMNTIVRSFSHESFKVGCDWSRAAFGPAGRLLAVGAADGSVYVWNTHTGRLEAILKDHSPSSVYLALKYEFDVTELERLRSEAVPSSDENATTEDAAPQLAEQPANVDTAVNTPVWVDSNDDGTVAQELELEQMRSTLDEAILETRSTPLENRPRLPRIALSKRNRVIVRALNPMLMTYLEASRDLCETDSILFGAALADFPRLDALLDKVVVSQPGEQELKNVSQGLGPSSVD
ncbi:unnamed protein product [Parnassius apollo]|uniref:(apollo) hypothetical protein n=1 Tax=Parnassius apollo TaxID=110799 RepID=A0A8S3WNA7_PARAO|nr:unnamed protein product [Parnassius apollo]